MNRPFRISCGVIPFNRVRNVQKRQLSRATPILRSFPHYRYTSRGIGGVFGDKYSGDGPVQRVFVNKGAGFVRNTMRSRTLVSSSSSPLPFTSSSPLVVARNVVLLDYKDVRGLGVAELRSIWWEVYGEDGKGGKKELLKGLKRYCVGKDEGEGEEEVKRGEEFDEAGFGEPADSSPDTSADSSRLVKPTSTPSPAPLPPTQDSTYVLKFDGGSRGNPGPSGCGWVIYHLSSTNVETEFASGSKFLGVSTNNQAEYKGLEEGLIAARELGILNGEGKGGLVVIGDSQLVVKQITGEYRVKNKGLMPIWKSCMEMMRGMNVLSVEHTLRGGNKRADELANEAMDKQV